MRFDTTNWSVILEATAGDPTAARAALATLCEIYWPPVYALIRSRGHSAADAEDLTQTYFARRPRCVDTRPPSAAAWREAR